MRFNNGLVALVLAGGLVSGCSKRAQTRTEIDGVYHIRSQGGSSPYVTSVDVDNDGDQDLVVCERDSNSGDIYVHVLKNSGEGKFSYEGVEK